MPRERQAGTMVSAAPPSRSDQEAAALGSGGAGPGLGPEGPTPTCARMFRMTAGSCRVAIRRGRRPQWGHARTSIANARCIRAAQAQGRGVGFTPASWTCGQWRRRGRGLGLHASVRDHAPGTGRAEPTRRGR
jgi:hypothetical protein